MSLLVSLVTKAENGKAFEFQEQVIAEIGQRVSTLIAEKRKEIIAETFCNECDDEKKIPNMQEKYLKSDLKTKLKEALKLGSKKLERRKN